MAGDARLWDAFNYLTQHDDSDHSRSHVWGKVDRIVALRIAEKLFAPHVGCLLFACGRQQSRHSFS